MRNGVPEMSDGHQSFPFDTEGSQRRAERKPSLFQLDFDSSFRMINWSHKLNDLIRRQCDPLQRYPAIWSRGLSRCVCKHPERTHLDMSSSCKMTNTALTAVRDPLTLDRLSWRVPGNHPV